MRFLCCCSSVAWAKSRRSIRLAARTLDTLKRHKTAQNAQRLKLGACGRTEASCSRARPASRCAWSLTGGPFKRLLARAKLPEKTRFHDIRHTCATLLLAQGVHPKFVQELLGHASISITLDIYSHVLPAMGDQAALAMESALS